MKKIMLIGKVGCGKTHLCQCLMDQPQRYKKTQTVEVVGGTAIDTPGEYMENKNFYKALVVTAVEADCILMLQACNDIQFNFSPRMHSMFNRPMIGVLTKMDLQPDKNQIEEIKGLLELAGAERIFCVSCVTGEGVGELREYLDNDRNKPPGIS